MPGSGSLRIMQHAALRHAAVRRELRHPAPAFGACTEPLRGPSREDEQFRLLAEVWLALALVAAGVTYASSLLLAVADAHFGMPRLHVHPPWPFVQDEAECHSQLAATVVSSTVENAIASAPIWMRNTLLSVVVAQGLLKVTGFGDQSKKILNQKIKADAADEKLKSLLANANMRESQTQAIAQAIAERDVEHDEELNQSRTAAKGLLRLLLSGHGLTPVPRVAAGWAAITDDGSAQSTWHGARAALGLNVRQALAVSATKLLLWHWSQPVAFLLVFWAYFCQLSEAQKQFGMVVAAREVLYLATTLAGILTCPVYLLLDISTVWAEAETKFAKVSRTAMYILTPHNYVALCLVTRLSERGSRQDMKKPLLALGLLTAAGGVSLALSSSSILRRKSGPGWEPFLVALFIFLILLLPILLLLVASLNVAVRQQRSEESEPMGMELTQIGSPFQLSKRQDESKGSVASAFYGLGVLQVMADFSSCFALGALLKEEVQKTAMIWGYSITAFGFLLFFGPASVVTSYKLATGSGTRSAQSIMQVTDSGTQSVKPNVEATGSGTQSVKSILQARCSGTRCLAGCTGVAMMLGLGYVVVGVALLFSGTDVYCMGFTGTSAQTWSVTCSDMLRFQKGAVCKGGLCTPTIQKCFPKIKEPFPEGVLSGERTGQDPLKNSAIFIFHVNSSWKLSGSAPGSVATTTRCQNNGKWAKPMIVPIVASDLWRNDSTSISDARCNSTSGANANCSFAVNIPSSVNMTESVKVHSLQLAIRGRSVKSRLLVDKPEWILADSTAFTISGVGQLEIENILLRRLEIDDVHLDQCNRKEILDSCRDVVLGGRAGMAFVQSTVQGIRMLLKQDSVLRIQSSDVRQSSIEVTGSGLVSVSGAERHDVATSLFDNTDLVSAFLGRFSFSDVSFTTTVHPVNRPQANTDLLLPFSMNRQAVSPGKYFTRMSMCMHT